jgi:MFS family permease
MLQSNETADRPGAGFILEASPSEGSGLPSYPNSAAGAGLARQWASGGVITIAGGAIGPPFFGYMVDATGSYRWAWLSLALVSALCVLLLVLVREEHRKI